MVIKSIRLCFSIQPIYFFSKCPFFSIRFKRFSFAQAHQKINCRNIFHNFWARSIDSWELQPFKNFFKFGKKCCFKGMQHLCPNSKFSKPYFSKYLADWAEEVLEHFFFEISKKKISALGKFLKIFKMKIHMYFFSCHKN